MATEPKHPKMFVSRLLIQPDFYEARNSLCNFVLVSVLVGALSCAVGTVTGGLNQTRLSIHSLTFYLIKPTPFKAASAMSVTDLIFSNSAL